MRRCCVCVPVRDEAARLPILLDALAAQSIEARIAVALCVNNSGDGTAAIARAMAEKHRDRLDLRIDERHFKAPLAHAGSARRAAMDAGAAWLDDPADILVSTDADCRPPEGWIAAILDAIDDERIVGGGIRLDEQEAVPADIIALRTRYDIYWAAVRAIEDAIDPCAWDAPPRHGDHTGASLAMTVGLYRRAGGVPLLANGEDRALVEAAIGVGGRLVHPASVWTRTSARADGRAAGGMAADMARLAADAGERIDPLVPHFDHWRRRATWRRALRQDGTPVTSEERQLPPMPHDMPLPQLADVR